MRPPNPNDGRKFYLSVNDEAIPGYKVYRRQDAEVIRRITDRYTPEEVQRFCEMLGVISDINLEELRED